VQLIATLYYAHSVLRRLATLTSLSYACIAYIIANAGNAWNADSE
jgi:hypothetical protein